MVIYAYIYICYVPNIESIVDSQSPQQSTFCNDKTMVSFQLSFQPKWMNSFLTWGHTYKPHCSYEFEQHFPCPWSGGVPFYGVTFFIIQLLGYPPMTWETSKFRRILPCHFGQPAVFLLRCSVSKKPSIDINRTVDHWSGHFLEFDRTLWPNPGKS